MKYYNGAWLSLTKIDLELHCLVPEPEKVHSNQHKIGTKNDKHQLYEFIRSLYPWWYFFVLFESIERYQKLLLL